MKYTRPTLFPRAAMFLEADLGGGGGDPAAGPAAPSATTISEAAAPPPSSSDAPASLVGADGTFADGWTEKLLPEELGESRKGFSKFRTVGELGRAYQGLESRLGKAAHAVLVPGEGATPEEVSAYRKALGVPESADKYNVKPENIPEGLGWDDEAVKPVLDIAHKHNVPEAAVKDFIAWDLERTQAREAAAIAEHNQRVDAATEGLKQLWKDDFTVKLSKAEQVARAVGIDPRKNMSFADPEIVKAFARMGEMISDDKFVAAGASPGLNSAAQAKDIQTNPSNPLYKRYQDGDPEIADRVRQMILQAQ